MSTKLQLFHKYVSVLILSVLLMSISTNVVAKRILICIDGTNNDPSDGSPVYKVYKEQKLLEDVSISNVLKLHLLAGGSLDNESKSHDQHSFYYVGVGNRGASKIKNLASAAIALKEPNQMLQETYSDLVESYDIGDSIYIFGFSRGAAVARILAQKINDDGIVNNQGEGFKKVPIRFLGLWDTVAAFGGINITEGDEPKPSALQEHNGQIAENIEQAIHLVSIDEPRLAFRPTLMGTENRVTEIWFPGVHSDIGGGYEQDGLSDITLEFMLNKATQAGLEFVPTASVSDEQLESIPRERLAINPDPLGITHFEAVKDDKGLFILVDQ